MASSVKNAFKTLKLLGRRKRCLPPIHRFDRRSDSAGNVTRGGLRGRMLKTHIDEFRDAPGLKARMIASELRVRPDEAKPIYFNWDLPAFLWEAILTSKTLHGAMRTTWGRACGWTIFT